jgi:transcriptional regulator
MTSRGIGVAAASSIRHELYGETPRRLIPGAAGTYPSCRSSTGESVKHSKSDLLQGTLDLLVLRTLASGDMHRWGISQRLQQLSQDVLQVNQGSLYPALYRLEQQGWIESTWGDSENNRRAKFYRLTKSGRKQLAEETASWERITAAVARVLQHA